MADSKMINTCFHCNRTEDEIPIVLWSYRQRPLSVCSACMPILIHKWEQVVATLATLPAGESGHG